MAGVCGCALVLELDPKVFTIESSYRGPEALWLHPMMKPLAELHKKLSLCSFHPYKFHKLGSWWTNIPDAVWVHQMPPLCEGHHGLCGPKAWTGHHLRIMEKGAGAEAAAFPVTLCRKLVDLAMLAARFSQ